MAERETLRQVYFNRRMAALLGLGFASGLPNVLPQDTLRAWVSQSGATVEQIGLLGLATFPYVFKFLWAPLLDRFMPPILGRRRGWLLIMQAGLALALLWVAGAGPSVPGGVIESLLTIPLHLHLGSWSMDMTIQVSWLLIAGAMVVFLSASQDIVADAYRTDVLPRQELGAGAAVFVMGYRIAMIASSAGVLFLAGRIGWRAAYGAAATLMMLSAAVTLLIPEPDRHADAPATLGQAIVDPVRQFISRAGWHALVILPFILIFRLPDVLGNAMTMPLLIKQLGFTLDEIGLIRQLIGFFVTVAGALVGGGIVARFGVVRSLWVFGILQAVSNAGFFLLAWIGNNHDPIFSLAIAGERSVVLTQGLLLFAGVITIESFCGGLVAAGFVAYLMSLCDSRYSAFQYAFFSAVVATAGLITAPMVGGWVKAMGYGNYFLFTIASGVPGMLMLPLLSVSAQPSAGESKNS